MQREICLFRYWYTLSNARNLKPTFEFQTPLARNSPAGTLELINCCANSDLRWNCPAVTSEFIPFGANSDLPWYWKFPETPSWGFFFAFSGTSEITPFGANLDLLLEFSHWHLGNNSFWCQLVSCLGFGIPGDSFSGIPLCFSLLGFTMLIRSWGTTYFPVGVLLCLYFLGELHKYPKDKIAYATLDPVADHVYIADLNTRLRVDLKTLPNLNFKLKFQTQISNSNLNFRN